MGSTTGAANKVQVTRKARRDVYQAVIKSVAGKKHDQDYDLLILMEFAAGATALRWRSYKILLRNIGPEATRAVLEMAAGRSAAEWRLSIRPQRKSEMTKAGGRGLTFTAQSERSRIVREVLRRWRNGTTLEVSFEQVSELGLKPKTARAVKETHKDWRRLASFNGADAMAESVGLANIPLKGQPKKGR